MRQKTLILLICCISLIACNAPTQEQKAKQVELDEELPQKQFLGTIYEADSNDLSILDEDFLPEEKPKTYHLISHQRNSELNYPQFALYDSLISKEEIIKAFTAIEGESDVYIFRANYWNASFRVHHKMFNDYLCLKVDPQSKKVLDAFQYTLEWAELPASSDLYSLGNSEVYLVDSMSIAELEMKLAPSDHSLNEKHRSLKDSALIILNPASPSKTQEAYCYLRNLLAHNDEIDLHIDFIQYFQLEEAIIEAKKRGDAELEVDQNGDTTFFVYNDYYIANDKPTQWEFSLSKSSQIELLEWLDSTHVDFNKPEKSLERLQLSPFKISFKEGEVLHLKEVFIP